MSLDEAALAVEAPPLLSVIVLAEAGADAPSGFLSRLNEAMRGWPAEFLVVGANSHDASSNAPSGDPAYASLSAAWEAARGEWLCLVSPRSKVPVSTIPSVLVQGRKSGADIILPDWRSDARAARLPGQVRLLLTLASQSLTSLLSARGLSPEHLAGEGTPLVRRQVLAPGKSNPSSLALLSDLFRRRLRVYIAHPDSEIIGGGEPSSLELVAGMAFLWRLRLADEARRIVLFLLIGLFGLVLNSAVLAFGKSVLGLYYLLAAVVAAEVTTVCNYLLVAYSVFPDRNGNRKGQRFLKFLFMNNVALAIRGPIMYALTSLLGVHYLVSNILAIVLFTVVRYLLADTWIWRSAAGATI